MPVSIGIAFAFVAALCWGVGDFLIQRSTRKRGTWESLFIVSAFGVLALFPFVYTKLPGVFASAHTLRVLMAGAAVFFVAGLVQFEAFRRGKLSVMEPLQSFEVPVSALLAFAILGEALSLLQYALIAALVVALLAVSLEKKETILGLLFEKGAMLGFLAALFSGGANFFMGWSGRITDPLVTNFFVAVFVALISGFFLVSSGRLKTTVAAALKNYRTILPMVIIDNAAWVAFVAAMTLAPIGIVVALSESYILIAVTLGLAENRERLMLHQKAGLVVALFSAISLAAITA